MERCPWADGDPLYERYHDEEWGTPVHDERRHFEFLLLETMQAGLSWRLILSRREDYRRAFDGFDWKKVARYDQARVDVLMSEPGIVHNRRKIEGAVKNAIAFGFVRKEFGSFDSYVWSFTGGKPVVNRRTTMAEIPARTELSDRAAADMKKRGFAFVGSVTIYAHFQAIGIVNDHLVSCPRYPRLV
ncbi:MAG: DNA-3-methyladenine glycosylase I [Spirochaetes bacterium]|nr:DNA-3-methyladenine glycosylase I [Spirochaetota bacterium]